MRRNRDRQIAKHILKYCEQVNLAVLQFGKDEDIFLGNAVYQNACAMPLMQIGELARKFSDDFLAQHPQVPWKAVKGMRNFFAHEYDQMDKDLIWQTIVERIPELETCLQDYLAGQ